VVDVGLVDSACELSELVLFHWEHDVVGGLLLVAEITQGGIQIGWALAAV